MKEVFYEESKKKMVIVVKYNLYFLDVRFIENMFIFFKDKVCVSVKNIGDFLKFNFVWKFIEIEDLKRILFFLYVFFVEGKFDKIVL